MIGLNKFISDRDLVDVLYRSILARKPDANGLKNHSQFILSMSRKDSLNYLIRAFLNSKEYKEKQIRSHVLKLNINKDRLNKRITINHLISLGTHCYTSYLLKGAGLKKYSCPFDWIFSSPGMVGHVINDDFNKFIDRKYFISTQTVRTQGSKFEFKPVIHDYYRSEFKITNVFNHHNPQLTSDYNYFVRSIERFRKMLFSNENVMFIVCTKHTSKTLAEFKKLSEIILKWRNQAVYLRYIAIEETTNTLPSYDIVDGSFDDFELIHFKASSKWEALSFENIIDDMALLTAISYEVNFNLSEIL